MKKIIEVSNLTKKFNNDLALNKLNFSVHTGEIFGFLGPSGAGKTTTIKILTGQLSHDGGDITILGQTPNTFQKIANHVGVVSDTSGFYEKLSIYDNLLAYCKLFSVTRTRLNALLKQVNLYNHRKTIVEKASTGMKQRFLLVRAIIHQPKLLFLDEPTSGLDPLMQREFFQILKERNERGTTIFLSSHILSEIQRNCTRAAIVRQGRMIACDRVEALAQASAKRVTVHGDINISGLRGVRDLQQEGDGFRFLYAGDINALLRTLAGHPVTDVSIAEPDLEEIFMHYYLEGGAGE